jgi:hypothetical protein
MDQAVINALLGARALYVVPEIEVNGERTSGVDNAVVAVSYQVGEARAYMVVMAIDAPPPVGGVRLQVTVAA